MSAIWDTYKYGENPFYNDPLQKAYYYPSPPRKMDGIARQASVESPSHEHQQRMMADKEGRDYFLDRSNSYLMSRVGRLDPSGDHSLSFDESWPQSERPSSISISEVETSPPSAAPLERRRDRNLRLDIGEEDKRKKKQQQQSSTLEGSGKTRGKESTLSKYIERFRNSQPMSREQRLEMKAATDADQEEDFWWLQSPSSSPPPSSSQMTTSPITDHMQSRPVLGRSQRKDRDNQLHDDDDDDDQQLKKKTKQLPEEKTNNFLDIMSSGSGSSHPAVSTIGLGSDDTNSLIAIEDEPYRPAFARSRQPSVRMTSSQSRRRPEDDILYRWRIQRKREQAKDEVTNFRTELPVNSFLNQRRRPNAESAMAALLMEQMQMIDNHHHNPQPALKEKDTETKRDAVIQTSSSGVLDEQPLPLVSCVPIACPHLTSATISSTLPPHCCPHLRCVCQAATLRHNATTSMMGDDDDDDDGPKRVVAHKAQLYSAADSQLGDGKKSHVINLDRRQMSDENIPVKDERCLHATHDVKETVNSERGTQKTSLGRLKVSQKTLGGLKVSQKTVVAQRDDLNDTDIWQTADERSSSEEADQKRQKRLMMGRNAAEAEEEHSANAAVVTLEEEEKGRQRHGMQQKDKLSERRRSGKKKKKNEISPIRIRRSTIRQQQMMNDRLHVTASASSPLLLSSTDNPFEEVSSLDLTVTELEEPANYDYSSVAAADMGGTSPPVDLEAVIYSDGEEFPDDDILSNLRQRRLFCLQRLQQLFLESKDAKKWPTADSA